MINTIKSEKRHFQFLLKRPGFSQPSKLQTRRSFVQNFKKYWRSEVFLHCTLFMGCTIINLAIWNENNIKVGQHTIYMEFEIMWPPLQSVLHHFQHFYHFKIIIAFTRLFGIFHDRFAFRLAANEDGLVVLLTIESWRKEFYIFLKKRNFHW